MEPMVTPETLVALIQSKYAITVGINVTPTAKNTTAVITPTITPDILLVN